MSLGSTTTRSLHCHWTSATVQHQITSKYLPRILKTVFSLAPEGRRRPTPITRHQKERESTELRHPESRIPNTCLARTEPWSLDETAVDTHPSLENSGVEYSGLGPKWLRSVWLGCGGGGGGADLSVAEMSLSIPLHEHAPNYGWQNTWESRLPASPPPLLRPDGGGQPWPCACAQGPTNFTLSKLHETCSTCTSRTKTTLSMNLQLGKLYGLLEQSRQREHASAP